MASLRINEPPARINRTLEKSEIGYNDRFNHFSHQRSFGTKRLLAPAAIRSLPKQSDISAVGNAWLSYW